MSDPRLVAPRPITSPASGGPASEPLPDDLTVEAAGRLRIACLVLGTLWVIGLVVNHLVAPLLGLPSDQVIPWPIIADVLAVGFLGLSLLVYWLAPRAAGIRGRLFTVAMAYEVAMAFAIGVINQWQPVALAGRLSWICVLILIFPSLVPAPPRTVLLGSLLAASMDPVGLLIAEARGLELPPLAVLVWAYLPNYICAGLAVVPSKIITHLGRRVSRARQLGSYRLVERIGQGGMGEVWKATHRMLAREAAIKLVRPETLYAGSARQAEVAVKRFKREANIIASLQSPHTVYLYDFGVSQDGRFYYVMELLDGISLQTLVTHFGPQPVGRVGRILRQMCDSLEEAHRQGLVHRDLKPSNLMLCKVALHYDFVKILDFGLAKHVGRGDITQLTMDGMASGTPGYIAPEIAMGDDRIDARADLYALGCVAYFLLTGTLVFAEDNPMRMALKHLQSEPDRPSLRTELPIPRSFEDLVMQCLRKRPEDRPGSAMEVSRRLRDCGIPAWSEEDAAGWWERHLPPSSSLRSFARVEQAVPAVIRKV
jgi:serine/threonine-protein kinase